MTEQNNGFKGGFLGWESNLSKRQLDKLLQLKFLMEETQSSILRILECSQVGQTLDYLMQRWVNCLCVILTIKLCSAYIDANIIASWNCFFIQSPCW